MTWHLKVLVDYWHGLIISSNVVTCNQLWMSFLYIYVVNHHVCWARHLCGTVHWVYLMLLEVWFVSRSATGDESNAYYIHKCYYYYIKKCDNWYCQSCQWYLTLVITENSIHSIPIRCLTMWRLSSCSLMLSSELWVHYNLNPHRWLRIKGAAQVNQKKGVAKTKMVRIWFFKPRCFEIWWYIECSHFVFPAIKKWASLKEYGVEEVSWEPQRGLMNHLMLMTGVVVFCIKGMRAVEGDGYVGCIYCWVDFLWQFLGVMLLFDVFGFVI